MHVKLINPFRCIISRLDTVGTASKANGNPGYDKTFREPEVKTIGGKRVVGRQEHNEVAIRAQIEDRTWEALRAYDNGIVPEIGMGIVADFLELKRGGYVDCQTGRVLFNVNDRLDRIEDLRGNLVTKVRTPPGLYCREVRPMSYGIGGVLNLVMLLFEERNPGVKA